MQLVSACSEKRILTSRHEADLRVYMLACEDVVKASDDAFSGTLKHAKRVRERLAIARRKVTRAPAAAWLLSPKRFVDHAGLTRVGRMPMDWHAAGS